MHANNNRYTRIFIAALPITENKRIRNNLNVHRYGADYMKHGISLQLNSAGTEEKEIMPEYSCRERYPLYTSKLKKKSN
jgi:hypothetical protein